MRRICLFAVLSVTCIAWAVPLELDYVYPSGCKRGESCQISVGGNWAGSTIALGCSGDGVKAVYAGGVTVYLPKKSSKKAKSKKPKLVAQNLPGHSLMNLTVDGQAEPGMREVYVDYRCEVSNPLKFEISDYDEVVEAATNTLSGTTVQLDSLPVSLNGRVFGEKPDQYSFQAASGQTLVACLKADLLPPGGFIPSLQIADAKGQVLTSGISLYLPEKAPILVFEVPAAGIYSLLVGGDGKQDGRSAVYRIAFGELSLITDFSPKLAVKGKSINVRLKGVNLEDKRVRLFTEGKDSAMCMQSIAGDSLVVPGLNFNLVDEIIISEAEPNNGAESAQKITIPSVVKGSFAEGKKDSDFFSFSLAPGGEVYADVSVPSLSGGKMLDVKVVDPAGKTVPIERNMSMELRKVLQSSTLSFPCRSDAGGVFTVEVSRKAGALQELDYRLRVGPPSPDYSVWMTPVSINMPINGSCLVNLFVHRKHGYNVPVSVAVAFPPLGVLSSGGVIEGDKVDGLVTVWTDAYRYPRHPFYQELMASSTFNGVEIKKPVKTFMLSKGEGTEVRPIFFENPPARIAPYAIGMSFDASHRSGVVLSQKKEREVKLTFRNAKGSVSEDYKFVLIQPATGVVVKGQSESTSDDVVRLRLALDGKGGLKPGSKGFLIIGMFHKGGDKELITASQAVPFSCK